MMHVSSVLVLAVLGGCAGSTTLSRPQPSEAEGLQLWVQVTGQGDPTVVFEAGGGDDSSVWAAIEPEVRLHERDMIDRRHEELADS